MLTKLNKKILNNFSNLSYLITPSTGLTHLDTNYLLKRNIKLINLDKINDIRDIKASSEFCFKIEFFSKLHTFNLILLPNEA